MRYVAAALGISACPGSGRPRGRYVKHNITKYSALVAGAVAKSEKPYPLLTTTHAARGVAHNGSRRIANQASRRARAHTACVF